MKCIICNNPKLSLLANKTRDSNKHSIVKCPKCELVQLSPVPTDEELKKFYNEGRQMKNISEPTEIDLLRKNQKSDTIRRTDFVSKLISPPSSILDIGTGFGFFLEEMKKRKFNVTGIEISKFARQIAKRITKAKILDIDIFTNLLSEKFDAVTLFHVLEHIKKTVSFLRIIKSSLKENGKLIIEVPNLDDLMLKSNEAYRNFYWQKAHLLYFNAKTLISTVKKAGFLKYKIYYEQRYSLNNFMNWMINNQPQIQQPSFKINGNYQWLEDIYKKRLIETGKSDTLILIALN
ncbi:MAG: hypothetical protein ACD_79C01371G0002 [uncultured bacterium]|nr:MAG: hypothetical protein ACD_79C01371G0002 [uncultured bacterium]